MVAGFHKTLTSIQDIVSCCLGSLAVPRMLSSSNTGQVHFTWKTKVPCICTLNYFIFQMALRNKSETPLLKCLIQISGQDHWHFCALTGKCAVVSRWEAAEVLLKDSWVCMWMWRARREGAAGCVFITSRCVLCIAACSQSTKFSCMGWVWSLRMGISVPPQYRNICQGFSCCSANETSS